MVTIKVKFLTYVSSVPRFLSDADGKFQAKLDDALVKLQHEGYEIIDIKLSVAVPPLVYTALIIYK